MPCYIEKNKTGIELAKSIVQVIDRKIKREYWTNERIEKDFAKRSSLKIFYDESTCFMNPCLDLTLTSASILFQEKIPYFFIIEEHKPTEDFDFNRLHFALEFKHNEEKYVLNYKRGNEVHVYPGNYEGRKDIPRESLIIYPGTHIKPDFPIYKSLFYDSLEELAKEELNNYSFEKNINRLKKDNSLENFKRYKEKFGEEFNIITSP